MHNKEKMMAHVQKVREQTKAARQSHELTELCDVITTTFFKNGLEYFILQAECQKQPTVIIAVTALKPRTDKDINKHWVNKKLREAAQQYFNPSSNGAVNSNGTGIKQVSLSNTMELGRQQIHVASTQYVGELASNFSDISSEEILAALKREMGGNSPHPVLTK